MHQGVKLLLFSGHPRAKEQRPGTKLRKPPEARVNKCLRAEHWTGRQRCGVNPGHSSHEIWHWLTSPLLERQECPFL